MINNFKIRNYKNIGRLVLDDLKQINLLMGDNNVGKSNILEAILLYASQFNLKDIQFVLNNRGEHVPTQLDQINSALEAVLPLVPNYDIDVLTQQIGFEADGEDLSIGLMFRVVSQENNRKTSISLERFKIDNIETKEKEVSREIVLVVAIGNVAKILLPISQAVSSQIPLASNKIIPCKYVHCTSRNIVDMEILWGSITMTKYEKYVMQALRIIEPEISQFNIIKDVNNKAIPKVKIGDSNPIPIFAMGDGMCHILNIILALLNVPNGILLLDEIDSGLHFNKHLELWKILTQLSNELNIQIFATTHNQDCMRALAQFSIDYETENSIKPSAFYGVSRNGQTMSVSRFTDYDGIISRIMITPEDVK